MLPVKRPVNRLSLSSALHTAAEHHESGRLVLAVGLCRRILVRFPDQPGALHRLGLLAYQQGRYDEATSLLRRAARVAPDNPDYSANLAAVLWKLGRRDDAATVLTEAVQRHPDHAATRHHRGVVLDRTGRSAEAVREYRRAIELKPDFVEAHTNLGNCLRSLGRLDESADAIRRALELRPGHLEAHAALAVTLGERADAAGMTAAYRRALEIQPRQMALEGELLIALHYRDHDPKELFGAHLAWAARHAEPLYVTARPCGNDRDPDRRLRVGYVSPDFRDHPVRRQIEPVLAGHDALAVEVFCYSTTTEPDSMTDRIKSLPLAWRDVGRAGDEGAADLIRQDRIDVLVDLAGHMVNPRLLTFARKPAPVQVTYLGYPNTTGLKTMDYRITDALHDPVDATDHLHTEELVRLDRCCWCYQTEDHPPPVSALPAAEGRPFTFACLNRLIKVTPNAMLLWANILDRVPGSRLVALVGAGCEQDRVIRDHFAGNGVDLNRLTLIGRTTREQYLRLYQEIDLALDTFPYNGQSTTLDAMCMGVPTVSLAGPTHVSRVGLSILSAVGLDVLAATTAEQYVRTATELACDLPRLADIRRGLRQRMLVSPLADGPDLARNLEAAYRRMWRRWCGTAQA